MSCADRDMQCDVKNTSQYQLLPGLVNVFVDGSMVSRAQIQVGLGTLT
jgi:hypothetical protein